jgi:hypothetical protein
MVGVAVTVNGPPGPKGSYASNTTWVTPDEAMASSTSWPLYATVSPLAGNTTVVFGGGSIINTECGFGCVGSAPLQYVITSVASYSGGVSGTSPPILVNFLAEYQF